MDRQIAGDKYFSHYFAVLAALEIGAGIYGIFSCPTCGRKKFIQTVRIGTLIGIRKNLPPASVLRHIDYTPFNQGRIEWDLQLSHKFPYFVRIELIAQG
jgi:hypothetical protein